MTRRRGVIGLLVGLVVGGLVALMAVVVWRIYVDVRTREVTAEQCESESDSGWCVQRRIVVSDERGVSVTYPEAFYELD
jgi:hypothetical protein